MSKAAPEHRDGRRKLTPEHRAKLAATNRARYEALTPEQKAAQLARIGRAKPAADPPPAPPAPPGQGRRNPLAMTLPELARALRGRGPG